MQSSKNEYTRTLVRLHLATPKQLKEFEVIASKPDIMQHIGSGKTWTNEYIKKLVNTSEQDSHNKKSSYYHWLLVVGNAKESKVCGYVSLRPYERKHLQIRTFVHPSGQGHGSAAGILVVNEYYKKLNGVKQIFSLVSVSNSRSIKMRTSSPNWLKVKEFHYMGSTHAEFLYIG